MAQKHWIAVVHKSLATIMAQHGFVAFSHGKKLAADKVSVGDSVILYAPKTDFEGDPVQAFVGLAAVTGEQSTERAFPGTDLTAWTRAARFAKTRDVPVKPMLEDLGFVTNPRYWGMAFRRSLFEISQADFDHIEKAMI